MSEEGSGKSLTTIGISGFPLDATERELKNFCRLCRGFENVKLSWRRDNTRLLITKFQSHAAAYDVLQQLQGLVFDVDAPQTTVLNAQFAKWDFEEFWTLEAPNKTSGRAAAVTAQQASFPAPAPPLKRTFNPLQKPSAGCSGKKIRAVQPKTATPPLQPDRLIRQRASGPPKMNPPPGMEKLLGGTPPQMLPPDKFGQDGPPQMLPPDQFNSTLPRAAAPNPALLLPPSQYGNGRGRPTKASPPPLAERAPQLNSSTTPPPFLPPGVELQAGHRTLLVRCKRPEELAEVQSYFEAMPGLQQARPMHLHSLVFVTFEDYQQAEEARLSGQAAGYVDIDFARRVEGGVELGSFDDSLPWPWEHQEDEDGNRFFWNSETSEASWEHPNAL